MGADLQNEKAISGGFPREQGNLLGKVSQGRLKFRGSIIQEPGHVEPDCWATRVDGDRNLVLVAKERVRTFGATRSCLVPRGGYC